MSTTGYGEFDTTPRPIFPEIHWQHIRDFLCAKKTGQITLNVKEGKILVVDIKESFRVE